MSAVLQEQVTLDDAVLGGMRTFPNGCNFRVLFDESGQPWLEYGCYGVHINLTHGKERLLHQWFKGILDDPRMKLKLMLKMMEPRVPLEVRPETVLELKKREPCSVCGAPFFKPLRSAESRAK
jgi:hypothetical protein